MTRTGCLAVPDTHGAPAPIRVPCAHRAEDLTDGPRVPARWGSWPTLVCACGMWRIAGEPGSWLHRWRPRRALKDALIEVDLE